MPTSPLNAGDAQTAKNVLTACGVSAAGSEGRSAGLCAHIGCGRDGSPGLTAELAAGSRLLVHGICWDSAALARARKLDVAKRPSDPKPQE